MSLTFLIGAGLATAAIAYLGLALRAVLAHRPRTALPVPDAWPTMSVLKPLCGTEPGLYEALRSFCTQDYPVFQLVFGVRDDGDPAVAVVERLRAEFPDADIALVVDPRVHGSNLKVSNLMNMVRAAVHEVVVVSDSDVVAEPGCLRALAVDLADPRVGAVTCLYKGRPVAVAGNVWSRLGALFINDWFLPSVLVDVRLHGVDFCFGPVSAVTRPALAAIGGFPALVDHLADDHRLGRQISARGYDVRLSLHTVETIVAETGPETLLRHELRWGRTVRACRARDHALSVVTHPLPVLVPLLLFSGGGHVGTAFLAVYLALRIALHMAVHDRFRPSTPVEPWLVPVRDALCFVIWAACFVGTRVHWRDRVFVVASDGALVAVEE